MSRSDRSTSAKVAEATIREELADELILDLFYGAEMEIMAIEDPAQYERLYSRMFIDNGIEFPMYEGFENVVYVD